MCSSRATGRTASAWALGDSPAVPAVRGGPRAVGAGVVQRQKEGERAALPVDARELDLAAEQHGQLAADGEAEAGAAVFARRAGVGLLERLEDEPLLLRRDADAGVLDGEGDDLLGLAEHRVIGAPALRGEADANLDVAVRGELDGVGQQVLEDLLETLRVAVHGARQLLGELHVERQVLGLGHVPEVAVDGVAQAGEGDFLDLDGDGAGLDFREIEDVVDEVEEVGAGGVDVAGKLDLLAREVAPGVVGELLAEDEDGIERRAQLVGHVREELGLVFGGERQFGGFFLERVAGLLDLGVLALDFGVLLGEQLGLGAQLLIGLLELALAGLQLDRELLRLREQALGAHRRLDGVEDRADALGEQLEERERPGAEVLERGQLDDGLGLPFEEHGQHDDAHLPRFAETGGDREKSGGTLVSRMRFLSTAHWPTRPSPRRIVLGEWPAPVVRVAREQRERGIVRCCRRSDRWCPGGH